MIKEKWSTIKFDVFVLSFIFFVTMSQTISFINRSGACNLLHTSNSAYAMCVCKHTNQVEKTVMHGLNSTFLWLLHEIYSFPVHKTIFGKENVADDHHSSM